MDERRGTVQLWLVAGTPMWPFRSDSRPDECVRLSWSDENEKAEKG